MKDFREIDCREISGNPVTMIGDEWMLISAGSIDNCNTMTAAWGGIGFLWKKPVVTIYVRPQRYTYKFLEDNEYFTLSFFAPKYKNILQLCGAKSGRDTDKIAAAGLTPFSIEQNSIGFKQARLILYCKKLYYQDLQPDNFLDKSINDLYTGNDYHRFYVGEIKKVLTSD